MTMRGRFFPRSEYMQHVYSALVNFPGKIKTLPPAIVKSKEGPLWSGKQVIRVKFLCFYISSYSENVINPA